MRRKSRSLNGFAAKEDCVISVATVLSHLQKRRGVTSWPDVTLAKYRRHGLHLVDAQAPNGAWAAVPVRVSALRSVEFWRQTM